MGENVGGDGQPGTPVNKPQVAVVGGGLAGAAAALACADAGVGVTLLEAKSRLGGATYSFQRDGLWFDNGQHVHLRCCTAYRAFVRRIGAEGEMVLQDRLNIPVIHPERGLAWIRRSGLPAPLHLALSLASYRHLGLRERFRAARGALAMTRLDLEDASLDQRTFGDWLDEQGQSARAVEAIWDLIGLPTLNIRARDASLWLAAMVFQVGLLSDPAAADMGYATTPLARAHGDRMLTALRDARVRVRTGAAISQIAVGAGGVPVLKLGGEPIQADAVILAVPHDQAAALLPPDAHPHARRFTGLGVSPIVNLHVVYDRRVMDLPFAATVGTPLQWVFDRTESAGLTEGQCLAISLSGADQLAQLSTEELRVRFLPELARVFPKAADAEVLGFVATREHRATFRQAPGTLGLRPGATTEVPRLFLAGAWTATGWPATMEGAVRSGRTAARAALLAIGRTRGVPAPIAA